MEMEFIWKGALALFAVLFALDYFLTTWRVSKMARDLRTVVALLNQLLQLQTSQQLAQRGAVRSVGDMQLGPR